MDWQWVLILVLAALVAGHILGQRTAIATLLIGVDRDDRTGHKLGKHFYYLVPAEEYSDLRLQRHWLRQLQEAAAKQDEVESAAESKG